jgi:hypothetical protein
MSQGQTRRVDEWKRKGKLQRREKEVGTLKDPMVVRSHVESTQPNPAKLDSTTRTAARWMQGRSIKQVLS